MKNKGLKWVLGFAVVITTAYALDDPRECPGPVVANITRGTCSNSCAIDRVTNNPGCTDYSACNMYDCFTNNDAWTQNTYEMWAPFPPGVCQGCIITYSAPGTLANGYTSSQLCQ